MLFYLPDFNDPVLPETEALHCFRVLRHRQGDCIEVTDGAGQRATAEILDENQKKARVRLSEIRSVPKGWSGEIWLAVAPTKQLDRMEWMVEKCTEIGIDGFLFVRTQRTERPVLNLERLEKTALSAMKQSGQSHLPTLQWVAHWKQFPWGDFDRYYCADLGSEAISTLPPGHNKSLIFIGPEGDFTPDEIQEIHQNNAVSVRLRPQVLRTETAGMYALSLFHMSTLVQG